MKKNSKGLGTRLDASYVICTADDTRAKRATIPAEWYVQINLEASQPVTLLPVVLPKPALIFSLTRTGSWAPSAINVLPDAKLI